MKKLLALTTILLFSLLVFLPTVHAGSGEKMLIIHIRTQFWGVVGPAYASNGTAWGDFTGYIFALPVAYKMVGSTWHVHCTEYWFDYEPDWTNPLACPPNMTSGVDGIIDFEETPAKMVFNGEVKYATGPYVGLVGRNVHFEGNFTWYPVPTVLFEIEATLWLRPNK